jgi:hypothetical protein
MKLTRRQLRKLISEAVFKESAGASPPVDFMYDMIDVGSAMVKQLFKYVYPHRDKLSFKIEQDDFNVKVFMYYDNIQIGSVKSRLTDPKHGMQDAKFNPRKEKINLFEIKSAYLSLIKDVPELFKEKGFGPILYELCLEVVSAKGNDYYLTCDRYSLQPDAYNVWAFYYHNRRNDVEQKQLDNSFLPNQYSITDNPNLRYPGFTSEEFYNAFTEKLIFPQGPDEDEDEMIEDYMKYAEKKDPLMKAYRKDDAPFLTMLKLYGVKVEETNLT